MRIGYLINSLGVGGAERQLMRLAHGLVARGHQVGVLCYGGSSSLDQELEAVGVEVQSVSAKGRLGKVAAVRRWMYEFSPDVAHGVMKRASSVAVLARFAGPRCKVVASDMSTATYSRGKPALWGSLVMFRLADCVVTQTELNRKSLEVLAPWLRGRIVVVRNGLDIEQFAPPQKIDGNGSFRFCVVGSIYSVKNPVRLVKAVAELKGRGGPIFKVDWYGRFGRNGNERPTAEYHEAVGLVESLGVSNIIRFHGETRNVSNVYHSAHALIHVSLQEGFPNAVAEGMACGLPIVVSRVSDLPLVVKEAHNGFVVDENDPVSIAEGMERMMRTDLSERIAMGRRSRELAVQWFGMERFLDEYEQLYTDLLNS